MSEDCGNTNCNDHDIEYGGACSRFYRYLNVKHCPYYEPYKPPDPNRYKESFERATKYLEAKRDASINYEIVRKLKDLLANKKRKIFKRIELEELIIHDIK